MTVQSELSTTLLYVSATAAGNVDGICAHLAKSHAKVMQTASLRLRITR